MPRPLRSRRMMLGLVALGAGACRPQTSLDEVATTSEDGTTSGSSAADESTSTGDGELPLVICDEACTPLLLPTWSYEGPHGSRVVVEMVHDVDGSLVLGLQRVDGGLALVRLSEQGELSWSAAPGLPCDDCELEDIALHPSGDIIFSVTSPGPPFDPSDPKFPGPLPEEGLEPGAALLARFDVAANRLAWVQSQTIRPGEGARSRAGEVVVLGEDRIVATIVDGYDDGELLVVREYDRDGTQGVSEIVTIQPGSGDGPSPLAVPTPTGELLLAHPWFDEEADQMSAASWRMVPPEYLPLSHVPLPLPLDDLAVDSAGRRLELAHSRADQSVTLLLTGRRSSDPERWSATMPIITTSDARPALAIGPDDDVYAAARATPRLDPEDPYVVMLEVARWSSAGDLRWQARRPLDMMATDDPLELVVDQEDGLVVGTVVQGQLWVVRYEQGCACG